MQFHRSTTKALSLSNQPAVILCVTVLDLPSLEAENLEGKDVSSRNDTSLIELSLDVVECGGMILDKLGVKKFPIGNLPEGSHARTTTKGSI
ncbi:hypothetical protein BDN67DRAFT_1018122 [Paxillus ammoniavirescens]|nr:hypothetical protein BDN67DRAFT_1018122 [Paxillus ammoniavirescens]